MYGKAKVVAKSKVRPILRHGQAKPLSEWDIINVQYSKEPMN